MVRTSSSKRRRFLVLLVLGVLTVTTAGCGSPEPKGASNAATSTTAFGVIPAQHSLAAAKVAWVKGAKVASYAQSIYLRSAALDLAVAVSLGVRHAVSDQTAERELLQLAALPETNDSAKQKSEGTRDLRALNAFFDTTKLYE